MTDKRQERLKGRIDRFSVKGFRSLKDVDTISFPDLAVIIGSNGAGKSNCIKFFEMLSFMLKSQNLSEFVAKNGGADDQLFVATQSPCLVDCFDLENIIVAELKDGATELKTFGKKKYQKWLDDEYQVSDLWLQNILRNEG